LISNVDSDGDGFSDLHEKLGLNSTTALMSAGEFPPGSVIDATNNLIDSGPTVYTLANSPYWVKNPILVKGTGVLIIEAGVALKFDSGISNGNTVQSGGSLIVEPGIQQSYFTSIHDDNLQGDTNSNTNATIPSRGNWQGILVETGSTVNLDTLIHSLP